MGSVSFGGQLEIFSIRENKFLRSCGKCGDLSELGSGEYFSYSLRVRGGDRPFVWKEAYVTVDGLEPWRWGGGRLGAGDSGRFRIAYHNMQKCMAPGAHTAVWYFDGREVHRERFFLSWNMKWETVFPMPTREEIANYRNPHNRRSPYLAGWLHIPPGTRYTQYSIDFKAAHLPKGTYCCLGNWTMDLSGLKKRYKQVLTKQTGTHAYAGLQRLATGQTAGIMSFWDISCWDSSGKEITLRPKRLYPKTVIGGDSFSGEGTGARSIVPFAWEADHWYRMHLKCVPAPAGTTLMEQWVHDLETGEARLLCRYDTGIADSAFLGPIAIFLENFLPETAGEVRSMEVRGARYLSADTDRWQAITSGQFGSEGGAPQYEGSYSFGASEDRVWMITSGVGGDWFHNGKGKRRTVLRLPDKK